MPAASYDGSAVIHLSAVTKLFGMSAALVRVDLDVSRGEVVLLHGPNGAGKSTLLAIIATALAPTYGTGRVLGLDLDRERNRIRRGVELLGHRAGMYDDLTARQNLAFWGALHDIATDEVTLALDRVGLSTSADERVHTFSQGMRQRLALARAFLRRPPLILLDEPYAGLDEDGKAVTDELIQGSRSEGRTVVVATHDVARASTVADRLVGLGSGAVVSESRAHELVRS